MMFVVVWIENDDLKLFTILTILKVSTDEVKEICFVKFIN